MKNLFLFGLVVFLASCSELVGDELDLSEKLQVQTVDLKSVNSDGFERGNLDYLQGGISVTCTTNACEGGNTGPSDRCQVGTDMNGIFECTCSGCKMKILFDNYNSDIDVWDQIYRENLHFEDFVAFVQDKHGESINTFNRVDFNFQPKATTIIYTYELADGSEETVMYSNTYTERGIADKTYEIDCSGSCGCREIFDFNTNRAECSCDPCTLTVKVKE